MKNSLTALLLAVSLLAPLSAVASDSSSSIVINDTLSMSLSDVIAKGLPVLYIETVEGEEPTCDYVSAPPGCMGMGITNTTKVPGQLVIFKRIGEMDSVVYDSGDYEADVSGMTIRIRGNTSAYTTKKPYKIKLQKKSDLLMRGNDAKYKDKDWLLLKDPYLLTLMGFTTSSMLNMQWTPGFGYVNVIMNGEYRGLYMLCESVKRNPDCRIDVDKTSGYLFECDPYWWNEDLYVNSITAPSYNFTFKYPESEDMLPEQLTYIQQVCTAFENSLSASNYPDLIDVKSWATWCLAHDMCGTQDSGGANRYYSKWDSTETSLVKMPVLWDFDMAERTEGAWSLCHTEFFTKLFNNPNRRFVDEYVWQYRKINKTFTNNFTLFIIRYLQSADGKALIDSYELEKLRWNANQSIWNLGNTHAYWYKNRILWMNDAIDALNPVGDANVNGTTDIGDVSFLIDVLLGDQYPYHAADINNDGRVAINDVSILIDMLLDNN